MTTRTWDNLTLEMRTEYGVAARKNRGAHSGTKIHRLISEYIVAVEDPAKVQPGTLGARFVKTGRPVLFSCSPACGCTQGQNSGKPTGRTAEQVTCEKCK